MYAISLLYRNLICLLFFLWITSFGWAQKSDIAPDYNNSLLWEISGNGLAHKSFVFGTIHLIPQEKYLWTEAMEAAFQASDQIVFELDIEQMSDPSTMMGMMKYIFMSNDTTLSDLLSDEEYELVNTHFKKMGMPLFLFERMKPFFLTVFLSEDMAKGNLQDGSLLSYEMVLNGKAKESNKPTSGLETIEFQASIFDKIPYREQAQMLIAGLQEDSDNEPQLDQLVQYYLEQNITELGKMITEQSASSPSGWEDDLLITRNINWIQLMKPMMRESTVFFAVGAGHLPGEKGVLQLLRKEGYTLRPIR
jgi:uncharacterized protein YbaP (TraB family)